MKKLVIALVCGLALGASAVELSADFKTLLDKSCAKMAKENKDAPCNGVANAVLFDLMMNNATWREKLKDAELSKATTAYCATACEAARK